MNSDRSGIWRRAAWIAPAIVVSGSLIGYLSNSGYSNGWFAALEKPSFMPPGWAFGPIWTILYALLGFALALILGQPNSAPRRRAIILFLIQLALNFAWSPIFFGGRMIDVALVTLVAMLIAAIAAAIAFARLRPLAGLLMLPYLAWLGVATALNAEIGRLNPGADSAPLWITGER